MRLIDADALLWRPGWMPNGSKTLAVSKEDIDAAPTVRCEECQYLSIEDADFLVCNCARALRFRDDVGPDDSCPYFERRTP